MSNPPSSDISSSPRVDSNLVGLPLALPVAGPRPPLPSLPPPPRGPLVQQPASNLRPLMQLGSDLLDLARRQGVDMRIFVEGKELQAQPGPWCGLPGTVPLHPHPGLPRPAVPAVPGPGDDWREGIHDIADFEPLAKNLALEFAGKRSTGGTGGDFVQDRYDAAWGLVRCLQLCNGKLVLDLNRFSDDPAKVAEFVETLGRQPAYFNTLPDTAIDRLEQHFTGKEVAPKAGRKRKSRKSPVSIEYSLLRAPRGLPLSSLPKGYLNRPRVVRAAPPAWNDDLSLGAGLEIRGCWLPKLLHPMGRYEMYLGQADRGVLLGLGVGTQQSFGVRIKSADTGLVLSAGIYRANEESANGEGCLLSLIDVPVLLEDTGELTTWMQLRERARAGLRESKMAAAQVSRMPPAKSLPVVRAPHEEREMQSDRRPDVPGTLVLDPAQLPRLAHLPDDVLRAQLQDLPGLYRVVVLLPDEPDRQAEVFAIGARVGHVMATMRPYTIWPGPETTPRALAFRSRSAVVNVPARRLPEGIRTEIAVDVDPEQVVIVNLKMGLTVKVVHELERGPAAERQRWLVCEFEDDFSRVPVRITGWGAQQLPRIQRAFLEGDRRGHREALDAAVVGHLGRDVAGIVLDYCDSDDLRNAFEQLGRALRDGFASAQLDDFGPALRAAAIGARENLEPEDIDERDHCIRASGLLGRPATVPGRFALGFSWLPNPRGHPAGIVLAEALGRTKAGETQGVALRGAIEVLAHHYPSKDVSGRAPDAGGGQAQ
jgi:hypothetical protein